MELESSWISEFEDKEKNYNIFYKETIQKIKIYSIYINEKSIIEKTKMQELNLENNLIGKHELAKLIKSKSKDEKINYKLISLLSYNNIQEPNDILDYKGVSNNDYLTVHKKIEDIYFNKSIVMFHDLTSLFLIFYQNSKKLNKNTTKKINYTLHAHKKTKRNRLKDLNTNNST